MTSLQFFSAVTPMFVERAHLANPSGACIEESPINSYWSYKILVHLWLGVRLQAESS